MRDAVARLCALLLHCNGTLLALAHDMKRHRKDVDLAILIGYNLSSWTGFKGSQIAMQVHRLAGICAAPMTCTSAPKGDENARVSDPARAGRRKDYGGLND